jgi:hypothetical protein
MESRTIEEVQVVCEYPEVFPKELPGMSPNKDIEFATGVTPRTAPIARFGRVEEEIRRIAKIKFIKPSSSPWGAPVLFVKK